MLGLIFAVIAGFVAKYLDDPVTGPLIDAVQDHLQISATEVRLVSFMLAMLVAGVLSQLLSSGSVLWLMPGGILGYFALRLVGAAKAAMDGRKG